MEVIIGQIYKHFKGNLYKVICLAEDSEDGRKLVIYQALYGENKIYARPYDMFTSRVDKEKYPNSDMTYRFEIWNGLNVNTNAVSEPIKTNEQYDENSFSISSGNTMSASVTDDNDKEEAAENATGLSEEVLDFLDAKEFETKVKILQGMKSTITDKMLETMAYSIDVELNDGTTYDKYNELLNCVMLRAKFECNRLR